MKSYFTRNPTGIDVGITLVDPTHKSCEIVYVNPSTFLKSRVNLVNPFDHDSTIVLIAICDYDAGKNHVKHV